MTIPTSEMVSHIVLWSLGFCRDSNITSSAQQLEPFQVFIEASKCGEQKLPIDGALHSSK